MDDQDRQVVITGAGVCCNLGDDLEAIEQDLRAGRGGTFLPYEPAIRYQCRCRILGIYEGDVSDEALGIGRAEGRFMGRGARLALKAARTALAASGVDPQELGVVAGSGAGDVATHLEIQQRLDRTGDAKRVSPTVIPRLMASTVSANLVNALRTRGPSFSASAACAGGAYNVLLAAALIHSGHMDAALAGGSEITDPHFHAGFDSMRAYNSEDNDDASRASRPYAADRAGFVFSEGAGMVVLETRAAAEARGATILGVLHGWGMSSDGEGEMVAPSSDGARRAMVAALEHAGFKPDAVGYVNTHGTSTPLGDVGEVEAIRAVMGGRHVPYSSTKAYTGHTVTAAGVIEAIFTAAMLRGGWVAPAIHADPLDPALEDYPPALEGGALDADIALSNSFGFGGTNVSLVLGRP